MGDTVGGFTVLRLIGRGGMGTVWEAEQDHPRRRVALKTITPDRVSKGARRRFHFEAQALGQLLHPGIPQVYAAGEDQGRLFIAMEQVDGVPLDEWAAGASRTDRLRTLVAICTAVNHAHLRGVVHRDLKPANVLVARDGSPKVLDFGIAQALGTAERGEVVGTLAWVSPEQLRGEVVDVRADVYSLGVLAYELFSGQLPITTEGRSALAYTWALQSERVVPLGERDRASRGDLDAIVAKALERDRERRYASAEAFGADLQRHLDRVPVLARRPTPAYVAQRWVQRNAGLVLAAGVVLASLATGLQVAVSGWRAAELAWRTEAEEHRRAEEALARAETERERAEAVTTFLTDLLEEAHPDQAVGEQVTVEQALDRAVASIAAGELAEQPAVEVAVRGSIAWVYDGLGRSDRVVPLLEGALALRPKTGPTDAGVSATVYLADRERGRHDARALELLRAARADLEALHPEPHRSWVNFFHTEGRIHHTAGRFVASETAFREALRIAEQVGEATPTDTWNQLARTLTELGRLEEAEDLFGRALVADRAEYGERHPQVATGLVYHGGALGKLGRFDEGLASIEQGLAMRAELLGPDHRRTLSARMERFDLLLAAGRIDAAAAALLDAKASYTRGWSRSPDGRDWRRADAELALAQGRLDDAAEAAEAAWRAAREELGDADPDTAALLGLVGRIEARLGRASARQTLEAAARALEPSVGVDGPALRRVTAVLATL